MGKDRKRADKKKGGREGENTVKETILREAKIAAGCHRDKKRYIVSDLILNFIVPFLHSKVLFRSTLFMRGEKCWKSATHLYQDSSPNLAGSTHPYFARAELE